MLADARVTLESVRFSSNGMSDRLPVRQLSDIHASAGDASVLTAYPTMHSCDLQYGSIFEFKVVASVLATWMFRDDTDILFP